MWHPEGGRAASENIASKMSNFSTSPKQGSLRELAFLFLRLGTTAFGGPAAHIAMMEEEIVRRRKWLDEQEFLDYLSVTNFIPGPNSTEMAIHIGHKRGGWPGLVVAGTSFIVPAVVIVGGLAWAYVRFGTLPQANGLLYGVRPVVIAIVVQALWKLGRSALKTEWLWVVGLVCLLLTATGVNELLVLALGGFLGSASHWRRAGIRKTLAIWPGIKPAISASLASAAVAYSVGLWSIFLTFAKIGSVLFGSGYVLLAFLRADLVERHHWLDQRQLLDAVAVGQVTPGPVFTTATFVGYLLHGWAGGAVATLGIFLPAFLFVAITAPLLPRLRASKAASCILDGVNTASLALMGVVTCQLARASITDAVTILIAVASLVALLRFRVNSAWLVLLGAIAGLLTHGLYRH